MEPTGAPVQSGADSSSESARSAVPTRFCLIRLAAESLAIELDQVREVFRLESVTPVPGMPPSLVGVANLRGTVVPLVDLRASLGGPSSTTSKYALVVRHGARQIGILIDEMPEILMIQPDDVLDVLPAEMSKKRPYLSGLVKLESRMSGMLEVSRLLAMVEGATDQQAA
jgi:purine-binding chemotaxis protein CheW